MNQTKLEKALKQLPLGQIEYHHTIGSTNDRAAELARAGAPHLSLVAANEQTKGRGRAGRGWFTPPDSALAFSLVLRGDCLQAPGRIPGLGALAVSTALEEFTTRRSMVKWPNDILLDGEKVCGVLAESEWVGDQPQFIILGIGINVHPASVPLPENQLFPATSIGLAQGIPDRLDVLAAVLHQIVLMQDILLSGEFVGMWEARLAFRGQEVQILRDGLSPVIGVVRGLDENGNLRLELPDGEQKSFSAGEIRLRPAVDRGGN